MIPAAVVSSAWTPVRVSVAPAHRQIAIWHSGHVAESDQGWTYLCGLFAAFDCISGASGRGDLDWRGTYARVRGVPYSAPGQPATFDQVKLYVEDLASQASLQVQWYNGSGYVLDDATFDALVGKWYVIAGVNEPYLQAGQNYLHFEVPYALVGGSQVRVSDSFRNEDGSAEIYQLAQFHTAMDQNEMGPQAIAFQVQ